MLNQYVLILHLLSAGLLFGGGCVSAGYFYLLHLKSAPDDLLKASKHIIQFDRIMIPIAAGLLLLSGFALVHLQQVSLFSFWLWGTIFCFIVAGLLWGFVVLIESKMHALLLKVILEKKTRFPPDYQAYFRYWVALSIPAFLAFVLAFYFMVIKP